MRTFLLGFVAFLCITTAAAYLFPMGELVTLHTMDENGGAHESTLWVMDGVDGALYLRAGDPQAAWLDRLILHPLVELEREDGSRHYRATPVEDAALRAELNTKLAEKYGVAETLVRSFRDVGSAVVVRLDPLPGEGTPNPHARGPHGGTGH